MQYRKNPVLFLSPNPTKSFSDGHSRTKAATTLTVNLFYIFSSYISLRKIFSPLSPGYLLTIVAGLEKQKICDH